MRQLGKVSRFTKSGAILLRSIKIPSLNSAVVTKDSKKVGIVRDVFGPSSKPYILIQPTRAINPKDISSLKNVTLYEIPRRKSKRRRYDGEKKG